MTPEPCPWDLQVEDFADGTVARFVGPRVLFDAPDLQFFDDQLFPLAESPAVHTLVLDLHGVDFLYSEYLGKLIALHKRLQALGKRLILYRPGPVVEELIRITRLDGIFSIRRPAEAPPHWQGPSPEASPALV